MHGRRRLWSATTLPPTGRADMEISVALPDVSDAHGLVQQLAGSLEATVLFDIGQKEIRVRPGNESHGAIVRVVDVVGSWLEHGHAESAKLSLRERSYTLFGSG
jgi:hypothetical protein